MPRRAGWAAAAALCVVVVLAAPAAAQTPPPADDHCNIGPVGVPSGVCDVGRELADVAVSGAQAVVDPGGTIGGVVGGAITGPAGALAESVGRNVMEQLVSWIAEGAVWLVLEVVRVAFDSAATVASAAWFGEHYGRMRNVAALLLVPFLLAAVAQGVRLGQPGLVVKAVLFRLPFAVLVAGAAVALTQTSLQAVDDLSAYVASDVQADMTRFAQGAVGTVSSAARLPGASLPAVVIPSAMVAIGAIVMGLFALVIWLELLVRSAGIYIALAFLPLVLAAGIWPAVASWAKHLTEFLVALVLSKFVIVAVLAMAAAAGASSTSEGFKGLLIASVALMLAALSPVMVLAMVQFTAASAQAGRAAMPSPSRAAYAAYSTQAVVSRVMNSGPPRAVGGARAVAALPAGSRGAPALAAGGRSGGGAQPALAPTGAQRAGPARAPGGAASGPGRAPAPPGRAGPPSSTWRPVPNTAPAPPSTPRRNRDA